MVHQNLSKIAIVGRPNVGKSSIYNRIIGKRESIIDPTPGVTRDRHYHLVKSEKYSFYLIDTGGITLSEEDQFASAIKIQTEIAITEADLILFVVEVGGLAEDDYTIADDLRKSGKPVLLIVNKCDNLKREQSSVEAYNLRLGEPIAISASHGVNFDFLLDQFGIQLALIGKELTESDQSIMSDQQSAINVAIVGKPNVGKSSLLNHLIGENRSLVSEIPGTTRDTIRETIRYLNHTIQFLDTAGMRRKSRVTENVEYYSVNRAVKSIERSDVVIHLIDSVESITDQDKKIVGVAVNHGRAVIIAVNKWDLLDETEDFKKYVDNIRFKFAVAKYIPVISISAKTGLRVNKLLKMIIDIYNQHSFRVDTNELNNLLQKAQKKYMPSSKKGRLKIYYGTQISVSPPKFLLFINRKDLMTKNYKDYLTNQLRLTFGFDGVPIFIYTKRHR